LFETYGDSDKRKKIIPTIIKLYSQNKNITIVSKKLKMNFVHIESLLIAINMIISNKVKEGEYCIKNNKFTNIRELINKLNKKLKKKIRTNYLSSKTFSNSSKQLKKFPYWDDNKNLEKFLLDRLTR
jgi:dTDP-D-glucose 4,6-dehydratase